jgi:hypothetical protein
MSVLSQVNWLGNQRVELQHLRSIDSYIGQDFESLSLVLAGTPGAVVSGLEIIDGSTTGFTVSMAQYGVVLAPVGNDAVFFANLGSDITQTLSKGASDTPTVYMSFHVVDSTSANYLPVTNETGPFTFIDPNTKKAFTTTEPIRRMVRINFSTTSSTNAIAVATIAAGGSVTLYKNRLFAADGASASVPQTLKEYVTQTDADITTAQSDITTLQKLSTVFGGIVTSFTATSAGVAVPLTSNVTKNTSLTSPTVTLSGGAGYYRVSIQGVFDTTSPTGIVNLVQFKTVINSTEATIGSVMRQDYGSILSGDKLQCSIEKVVEIPTGSSTISFKAYSNTSKDVTLGGLPESPINVTIQKVAEL